MQKPLYQTILVATSYRPKYHREICQFCGLPFRQFYATECSLVRMIDELDDKFIGDPYTVAFYCPAQACQIQAAHLAHGPHAYPTIEQQIAAVEANLAN